MDALSFRARGIDNVIAIGSNQIADNAPLQNLLKYKAKRTFIICPDNDDAGEKGLSSLLGRIWSNNEVYMAETPKEYERQKVKDINDLICLTEKPLESLLRVTSALEWYVNDAIKSQAHDTNNISALEEDKILSSLYRLSKKVLAVKRDEFLALCGKAFEHNDEKIISAKFKGFQAQEVKQEEIKKVKNQVAEIQTLVEAPSFNKEKLKDLSKTLHTSLMFSKDSSDDLLEWTTDEELFKEFIEKPDGLATGYAELDKYCTISQNALTIIGGRPGQGKTTFMMNLLMNMLEQYEDHTFLFLSFEETRHSIWRKLISIKSNAIVVPGLENKNMACLSRYISDGADMYGNKIKEIDDARLYIARSLKEKRLSIAGKTYKTDQIDFILQKAQEQRGKNIVAFVDYIQKIPGDKKKGTRQLELQEVCADMLKISQTYQVPLIMGCQMRRTDKELNLDSAREAGDIEQDAELFLSVENNADQEEFVIKILKNRNGIADRDVTLGYKPPTFKVYAPIKQEYAGEKIRGQQF